MFLSFYKSWISQSSCLDQYQRLIFCNRSKAKERGFSYAFKSVLIKNWHLYSMIFNFQRKDFHLAQNPILQFWLLPLSPLAVFLEMMSVTQHSYPNLHSISFSCSRIKEHPSCRCFQKTQNCVKLPPSMCGFPLSRETLKLKPEQKRIAMCVTGQEGEGSE